MPIKLNAGINGEVPVTPIILQEIKKMTDRYRAKISANDAKSVWVSKDEIEALLEDNPGSNGIRMYYGRHKSDPKSEFDSKHNIILVSTKGPNVAGEQLSSENSVDQLNEFAENGPVNSVVVSFEGMGSDAIPLCPPHCPKPPTQLS